MAPQSATIFDDVWEFRLMSPQPISFYFPLSKVKMDQHEEWFHQGIEEHKEDEDKCWVIHEDCDATAFGLYLFWNAHGSFNPLLDRLARHETDKGWLLLANCWRVAQEMSCNGFRRVTEQAMIDFAKAREDNCPSKATLKKIEAIVDNLLCELFADIWIFHHADCGSRGCLWLTPSLKNYVISRLASLGGKDITSRLTLTVGPDTFGA